MSQIFTVFATNLIIMTESIEKKILLKINGEQDGTLFFSEGFVSLGSGKAISKALERLTEKGAIRRVARGIYAKPQFHALLGELHSSTDEIAQAIAKRDKARIMPTGIYALNALGLSTQVPMNVVYLTDGVARKIKMDRGGRGILFKRVAPKNLASKDEISGLVIQALKIIEKDKVTEEEKAKIIELLRKENVEKLEHDIQLAPEWIRLIMKQALKKN